MSTFAPRAVLGALAGTLLVLMLGACQAPAPRPEDAPAQPPAVGPGPAAEPAPARPTPARPGTRRPGTRASRPPEPQPPQPEPAPARLPAADLIDRLAARMDADSCEAGEQARHWRRRYAASPERFAGEIERVMPLLGFVLEQVEARELPGEFALIPIVESWYRTDAVARGGPAGLWQMIPSTARGNGVTIRGGYDGRFSVLDATAAALDHLADMLERFGDWRLAAMAYNAGEFRIARAARSLDGDQPGSGEQRLPEGLAGTTYEYISKLKALACLLTGPDRYRVPLRGDLLVDRLEPAPLGDYSGRIEPIARVLGLDADTVAMLNAGYRDGRVEAQSPRELLLPAEAARRLAALPPDAIASQPVAAAPAARSGAREHVVRAGDTLSAIARAHGLRLQQLLELNGLAATSIIRPGQRLKLAP